MLEKTRPAPELLRTHKTSLNSVNPFLEIYFNPVHINFTWTFHLMLSATTLSLEGSSYITGASSLSSYFRTLSHSFLSVSSFKFLSFFGFYSPFTFWKNTAAKYKTVTTATFPKWTRYHSFWFNVVATGHP